MAGLIGNAVNNTMTETNLLPADKTLQANATGYDPAQVSIDPTKQTVAGQLDSVLASDSPVLQRAQANAAQTANSRGLLNSSMGVEAGTAAMIDAATPIATADANTYNTAALANQGATNQALNTGANAANAATLTNTDAANKVALTRLDEQSQMALQQLRGDQATTLANIEASYKELMQTNSSAASLFNESTTQIATILRDPNTSSDQKASAVAAVNSLLNSSLTVAGAISNLDLGNLLNFSGQNVAPA